jgi:excisionase family DNA binding protein
LERLLVSIPDVCAALGIGRTTVYELVDQRQIVKVNIGRRSFVTAESLGAYVDRLSEAATA